jgi:hypothetical protein
MEDKNLEVATDILEKVLPLHFNWFLTCREVAEDGSVSVLYTTKSDSILNDLLKVLEENYGK